MKIELQRIPVRKVVAGYKDSAEEGVVGFDGKLDIRPKYQREFVYNEKHRNAVINTVCKDFPLNVMYWAKNADGTFEMLDGQQRTISIAQYVTGDFSIDGTYFHSLSDDQQKQIMDYELMIYFCEGKDGEKMEWFKTINISGVELTDQELRNAIYTGPWLTDAKRHFSKNNCAAFLLASKYLNGSPIRQDYLETAISWIVSSKEDAKIREYMSRHQNGEKAEELWKYFQDVIGWVQTTFPTYRSEMKGLPWGELYNEYHTKRLDPIKLEQQILKLIDDDEVQSTSGIYLYLLTGNEKYLNLRLFDDKDKRKVFEKQKGICPICKKEKREKQHWDISEMEADHITPWRDGGKTVLKNCQMLCKQDNRTKSGK